MTSNDRDGQDPDTLGPEREELLRQIHLEEELAKRRRSYAAELIIPNEKQWEFINSMSRQTMFSGLNQAGKTTGLCLKYYYHLTGDYPEGYTGFRHEHPINCALGGETAQMTRDHLVSKLVGPDEARGSGFIPLDRFDPDKDVIRVGGSVVGAVDYIRTKHFTDGIFDGYSKCYFFSYASGWRRLQGYTLHRIGVDEEPPWMVYDEFSARTNDTDGWMDFSMTPLQGVTPLIAHFEERSEEDPRNYRVIYYGVDDVEHRGERWKYRIRKKYMHHPQGDARAYGRPVRGVGVIYPYPDEEIKVEPFKIPAHWKLIIGLDFPHTRGTFAAVLLAYDTQSDTVYLVAEYKGTGLETPIYAERVKAMGGDRTPVAWPHDGNRTSGDVTIADQYRRLGLNMLPRHAHLVNSYGKESTEVVPVIQDIADRMCDGRFKVFSTCAAFFKEKHQYRQENGRPVKNQDNHLIDAAHKGFMSLRYARPGNAVLHSGIRKAREVISSFDFFG